MRPEFIQFLPFLATILVVDMILRGMALWQSARAKQKYWFVALLIVNSAGILPLVYLLFFNPSKKH